MEYKKNLIPGIVLTIFSIIYLVLTSQIKKFSGTGTGISIQELEQRIITEWLPTSGFEFDNAPDIEVYLNPDPNNTQYEVWLPIRKV